MESDRALHLSKILVTSNIVFFMLDQHTTCVMGVIAASTDRFVFSVLVVGNRCCKFYFIKFKGIIAELFCCYYLQQAVIQNVLCRDQDGAVYL